MTKECLKELQHQFIINRYHTVYHLNSFYNKIASLCGVCRNQSLSSELNSFFSKITLKLGCIKTTQIVQSIYTEFG